MRGLQFRPMWRVSVVAMLVSTGLAFHLDAGRAEAARPCATAEPPSSPDRLDAIVTGEVVSSSVYGSIPIIAGAGLPGISIEPEPERTTAYIYTGRFVCGDLSSPARMVFDKQWSSEGSVEPADGDLLLTWRPSGEHELRLGVPCPPGAARSLGYYFDAGNPAGRIDEVHYCERNLRLGISGRICSTVPGGVGDVAVVNLTPVEAAGLGHGQLVSSDVADPPVASNVNYGPGSVDPNLGFAPVGADGEVCYVNGPSRTHLVADHLGTLDGDVFTAATPEGEPSRKVDTRVGLGGPEVRAGGRVCFAVPGGVGDVAVVNLTPVEAAGLGHGQLVSSDVADPPVASNVNYGPGSVDPNLGFAPVGADGEVCYVNGPSRTHLVADHLGTLDGDVFTAATPEGEPSRKVDTRIGALG